MKRTPYDCVCAVSVRKWSSEANKLEGTGSGVLIDAKQGLVLSHASLLNPFVSLIKSSKLSVFRQSGILERDGLTEKLVFSVFLPAARSPIAGEKSETKYSPELLNCNLQEATNSYTSHSATMKLMFVCQPLKSILDTLVPSESWQLADEVTPNLSTTENSGNKKSRELDDLYQMLLPCFVLLKLKNWQSYSFDLKIRSSLDNQQGDPVEICASPFGALSPEVFLNSHSRGIISNLAGRRQVLILTDARCVPGSDGGALFYCHRKERFLTGIIIASLCWKSNEWVGLSLACAVSEVLRSLRGYSTKSPEVTKFEVPVTFSTAGLYSVSMVSELKSLVPLISVGNSWGSGVVLDAEKGTILTCSHVVKACDFGKVMVHDVSTKEREVASVVYRNKTPHQFDLAVVQVPTKLTVNKSGLKMTTVKEGEVVYVIGHGLFGAEHDLSPSVTAGVVSKVIFIGTVPVMIQTTCAVHAGASGGAVFNRLGHLVAIVVCNSKDTMSGACYPHVNMCVPIATVAPILQNYLDTGDVTVLQNMHLRNKRVQQIWSIGSQATSLVSCKL